MGNSLCYHSLSVTGRAVKQDAAAELLVEKLVKLAILLRIDDHVVDLSLHVLKSDNVVKAYPWNLGLRKRKGFLALALLKLAP